MKKLANFALVIGVVLLGVLLAVSIYINPNQDPSSPDFILRDAPYDLKEMTDAQTVAFLRKNNVQATPAFGVGDFYYGISEVLKTTAWYCEKNPNTVIGEDGAYYFDRNYAQIRSAILKHYGIEDLYAGQVYYDTSGTHWWELP